MLYCQIDVYMYREKTWQFNRSVGRKDVKRRAKTNPHTGH